MKRIEKGTTGYLDYKKKVEIDINKFDIFYYFLDKYRICYFI